MAGAAVHPAARQRSEPHEELHERRQGGAARRALYTPEQRARRDRSRWTLVQGVLAPLQLVVCLVSVGLVVHALRTGQGAALAHGSILLKTALLYAIMLTGMLWERDVYGQLLFAPAFFWEDVVSMLVLALHTIYVAGLVAGTMAPSLLFGLALAGYAVYLVNAAQFLLKLRHARLDERQAASAATAGVAA